MEVFDLDKDLKGVFEMTPILGGFQIHHNDHCIYISYEWGVFKSIQYKFIQAAEWILTT